MILDAYGRPVRKFNSLITPSWILRELTRALKPSMDYAARLDVEARIGALRASAGVGPESRVIGNTVAVRRPPRYGEVGE